MNCCFVMLFLWILTIPNSMAQDNAIEKIIKEVEGRYAPDKRIEVFQIEANLKGDSLILKGVTTSKEAHEELLRNIKQSRPEVLDSIRLLPDAELGEKTEGVVYNSVGTIRYAPRYSSEIVTQTLLGTHVKILEKRNGWRRIQTPDMYIGWINGSVKPYTKTDLDNYNEQQKVIITSLYASSYEKQDDKSTPVSDLVIGGKLILKSIADDYFEVVYPDGREAYIKSSDALKEGEWLENITLIGESIVNNALQFKGIPYLWGGTSSKGLDCSGFTKTVYSMHGIELSRDASQQVNQGVLIDSERDFSKLVKGDLLFFGTGDRVVHVGIYIGDNHFIHASDFVRINSLNPEDKLYDEFNTKRYLRSKRYIENGMPVN